MILVLQHEEKRKHGVVSETERTEHRSTLKTSQAVSSLYVRLSDTALASYITHRYECGADISRYFLPILQNE